LFGASIVVMPISQEPPLQPTDAWPRPTCIGLGDLTGSRRISLYSRSWYPFSPLRNNRDSSLYRSSFGMRRHCGHMLAIYGSRLDESVAIGDGSTSGGSQVMYGQPHGSVVIPVQHRSTVTALAFVAGYRNRSDNFSIPYHYMECDCQFLRHIRGVVECV